MAVVKGPLMSLDARKSVGKTITFTHWKGRNTLRKTVKPSQPRTGLQLTMRASLRFMSQRYKTLTATQIANWKAQFKKRNITGLNSMLRFNQPRVRRGLGILSDPTNVAGAVEAAPTTVVATAGIKSVIITWVDSAGATDWCTFIYRSLTTGFTPGPGTLVAVINKGVQTFTDIKLTTGTAYFYRLGGCESGGTLGTTAAQVTATPT